MIEITKFGKESEIESLHFYLMKVSVHKTNVNSAVEKVSCFDIESEY